MRFRRPANGVALLPLLRLFVCAPCCALVLAACSSPDTVPSSPELARIAGADGATVFTVLRGGIVQEAKLAHPAETAFGALLERRRRRVRIDQVIHGGGAERALMIPGDVLIAVGGEAISRIAGFRERIDAVRPATDGTRSVEVVYERLGDDAKPKRHVVRVSLTTGRDAVVAYENRGDYRRLTDRHRLGIEVIELTPEDKERIYREQAAPGVVVTSVVPGGPAYRGGLRAGDRMTEVGGSAIETIDELSAKLVEVEPGERVSLRFEKRAFEYDAKVKTRGVDDRRYIDVPIVAHYTNGVDGSSLNLGYVLLNYETKYHPTRSRAPAREKEISLFFGLVRWIERSDERTLRLLWLIPIGMG